MLTVCISFFFFLIFKHFIKLQTKRKATTLVVVSEQLIKKKKKLPSCSLMRDFKCELSFNLVLRRTSFKSFGPIAPNWVPRLRRHGAWVICSCQICTTMHFNMNLTPHYRLYAEQPQFQFASEFVKRQ